MRTYLSWILATTAWLGAIPAASRLVGIPTVPFEATGESHLSLSSLKSVIVDTQFADARDERGQTLIPPSLHEFSQVFANDLKDTLGAPTSEGYTLSVSADGITVRGASPLGVWWGTRTVLQQAILNKGSLPHGEAHDAPGWATRGMMLDAGRHYYPPEFITEVCAYMSFFKQNTLQLHLSDNFNVIAQYSREFSLRQLFARFRPWSDAAALAGLNKYKNESYTREQFEDIQSACAARGVTILPEIEAPGHALAIVQWKPQLGLAGDPSLLNISHPDTIPTMQAIWAEFLPWFHSKTVHIGADEYTAGAAEYTRFVNEMSAFIAAASGGGKAMRIWGTFPPRPEYAENVHANVSIQHWAFFEDNPLYDYIRNNYSVLNSDDSYYVVSKWSGSYPQSVDVRRTFHGNPATTQGGLWYPHVFDQKNASNNPAVTESRVLGSVAPLWNDYGQNASVVSEAYYAWRGGIPALGDKQWGGDLAESEFASVLDRLHPKIPGQNLERSIPSQLSKIFEYDLHSPAAAEGGQTQLDDLSGNNYHATTDCPVTTTGGLAISGGCTLRTPLSSKGRDYTLSLELKVDALADPTNATLLAGGDSVLMLTPNLTLLASGTYYRLNSTVPLGRWVNLSIIGKGSQTFASVEALDSSSKRQDGDGAREEFLAILGVLTQFHVWAPVAIEAPLARVGGAGSGWTGELRGMSLTSEAL
ncbi:beta-hexosaminidase [Apiospora marii]|uniref:beta-N-acetylhexosaminidase n=1 Tax=Apiospora marii TaxID=335849 RepID=A0ABR1RCU4_9PEZI